MSYGLRVWNGAGQLRLEISDVLTRLRSTGSFTLARGATTSISVPGLTPDDSWVVIVTGPNVPIIYSGSFSVTNYGYLTNLSYAVYRR